MFVFLIKKTIFCLIIWAYKLNKTKQTLFKFRLNNCNKEGLKLVDF